MGDGQVKNQNSMIKINLPNPREMTVPEFFAHMKIALKSAEKSYEEIIKGLEPIEIDNINPWISFRLLNEEKILGDYWNAIPIEPSDDEWQDIVMAIDTL
jgi:hypothetical protein